MTAPGIHNETELFSQIAEGNESALRKLIRVYESLISRHATKIMQDDALAADVVQEVFIRIWLNRDKLALMENPVGWILKVTYHLCYSVLRKQNAGKRATDGLSLELQGHSHRNVIEENIAFTETSSIVRNAIEALPPQARRVYLLSRNEGLKIAEIAEKLGLSIQTVKNTLSRALKQIREYLQEHGIYLPMIILAYWL